MLKLLVIEDHTLVREGLVQILHQLSEDVEIFEAPTCEEACSLFEQGHDFDLVLLDLGLPGTGGMACLNIMRKTFPNMPVVIVSAFDDTVTINRALAKGASGFVPKAYSSVRLIAALNQVLEGQIFRPEPKLVSESAVGRLAVPFSQKHELALITQYGLTPRQMETLAGIVRGNSNSEIAAQLDVADGTVKQHITAIFKALGVKNRTQALLAVVNRKIKLQENTMH
jgi:DNA-binding NarL/FixJ family response regulator